VGAINIGDMQVQAAVWLPTLPLRAAGAAMKWATDRIRPAAWVILAVVVGGAVYWYCKQPPERRETIKKVTSSIGTYLVDQYTEGAALAYQASLRLRAGFPRPKWLSDFDFDANPAISPNLGKVARPPRSHRGGHWFMTVLDSFGLVRRGLNALSKICFDLWLAWPHGLARTRG